MYDLTITNLTRYYSELIEDGRTIPDIFDHLKGEVEELSAEVGVYKMGGNPGEDGITGEAVDVIVCALDLIFKDNPKITETEILKIVERKLEKWKSKTEAGAYK